MTSSRVAIRSIASAIALLCLTAAGPAFAQTPAATPIEIRVVVVTAFEEGADTGDAAGEFQAWAGDMPDVLPFPMGWRNLRYDPVKKTLVVMTSMGTNRAAVSTMALGLDPRFDLSHAYWVVAAIAGVNPNAASLGSAAWIGDVVDSDFAYVVDPRELPKNWIGFMPWGRKEPYAKPVSDDKTYNLFPLNRPLRDWAYARTKDIPLADSAALQKARAPYKAYPEALKPPRVLVGDEMTGQGFWHGSRLNEHAERWTRYWAGDQARFVMTGMEDTGVINAISRLQLAGKADASRVLVLRTGSNYSLPPAGKSPVGQEMATEFDGAKAAFSAAHLVARPIVDELSSDWARYRDQVPGSLAK